MNAFELNKIIGAVLGTLLLVMGLGFLAEAIYAPIEGRAVGYALPDANADEGHEEIVEVVEVVPLEILLASASADDGARVARKCQACHGFGEGDANKVGPALYGIVESVIGGNADFSYSDFMNEKNAAGDTWTYAALNDFLLDPKEFAPGTKMSFAGLSKDQDRVDMLAYLQTLSATPVAFPTAEGADAAVEAAVEETAPAVEEAVEEATEEVTPSVEATTEEVAPVVEAASEEVAPVVEATTQETAPAVEETALATETTAPETEEAAPVAEETAPVEEAATMIEETAPAVEETTAVAEDASFAALLAGGDVSKGVSVARKCKACHGFEADSANKVGPPLYDIVGRAMGSFEGFKYSDTLSAMGADGGVWTYDNLNSLVIKPRDFIEGTKMSFSGLRKEEDRVNLMVYLQSLSENPVPFAE